MNLCRAGCLQAINCRVSKEKANGKPSFSAVQRGATATIVSVPEVLRRVFAYPENSDCLGHNEAVMALLGGTREIVSCELS